MLSIGSGQIHLAVLAFFVFLITENNFKFPRYHPKAPAFLAGVFFLYIVLMSFRDQIDARIASELLQLVVYLIFFFLVLHHILEPKKLKILLWAMYYSSLVLAITGLTNYGFGLKVPPHIFIARGGNETATFLALMGILPATYFLVKERNISMIIGIAVIILSIYISTSRSNLLIVAMMLLLTFAFLFKNLFLRAIILVTMVGLAIYQVNELFGIYERELNFSALERIRLGEFAWQLYFEKFWFGWGWGATWSLASLVSYSEYPHFHNTYLQLLVELGTIGWIPIVGFLLFFVTKIFHGFRSLLQRDVMLFVINAFIGLTVSGMFEAMLFGADRALQVVIILALVARTQQMNVLSKL